ncbi:hypothetical protein H2198_008193 [Neophaeococcomyces mojaviensis]|uniref:Uncharacterized protein n=1 Tax=Neophaeococcomyces mojaviensis TaxID=3383035 RepID=A0ACC2ZXS6_9EURO|nr:hypothetical protein H2198_008193 [Knufia sp. JES_112]
MSEDRTHEDRLRSAAVAVLGHEPSDEEMLKFAKDFHASVTMYFMQKPLPLDKDESKKLKPSRATTDIPRREEYEEHWKFFEALDDWAKANSGDDRAADVACEAHKGLAFILERNSKRAERKSLRKQEARQAREAQTQTDSARKRTRID